MSNALPSGDDANLEQEIDAKFAEAHELCKGMTDRELLEHATASLEVIGFALGKMGDALPATLGKPIYRAALGLIMRKG